MFHEEFQYSLPTTFLPNISPLLSFSGGSFDALEATAVKETITIHMVSPGLGDLLRYTVMRSHKDTVTEYEVPDKEPL